MLTYDSLLLALSTKLLEFSLSSSLAFLILLSKGFGGKFYYYHCLLQSSIFSRKWDSFRESDNINAGSIAISHKSLSLCFFFFTLFSLCSDWVNSIDLSSNLVFLSSVFSTLLLSSSASLLFLLLYFWIPQFPLFFKDFY